ncbi:MAG TPA: TolC family protein [Treponemataceae bacterium]|nr:TolC family protein [Treponemataceae bacterium]
MRQKSFSVNGIAVAFLLAFISLRSLPARAEDAPLSDGEAPLSVEDAVARSLAADPRAESARRDWLASAAKAEEARLRELPSLSLSAGYTRLSNVVSEISLGPTTMSIDSLDNIFTLQANAQYPIFAGFRYAESARLAGLQKRCKEIAEEMTLRAIAFETERAYWEAERAARNERMLAENLELTRRNRAITERQAAEGSALAADLLVAGMRCDQAEIDLGNATAAKERAFLNLALLVGMDTQGSPRFALSSDPAVPPVPTRFAALTPKDAEATPANDTDSSPANGPESSPALDADALIAYALSARPETRAAAVSVEASRAAKKVAEAPLYPTLAVSGNYTYADPNSRVYFQSDPWKFTGTWSLGVALSWDVGGIPANLAERDAQLESVEKSVADGKRQEELVELDVRNCLIAYGRTESDLALLGRMVAPARENERVTAERVAAGSANAVDLLAAEVARLRSEYAVTNREIDRRIAEADLARACGIAPIGDIASRSGR